MLYIRYTLMLYIRYTLLQVYAVYGVSGGEAIMVDQPHSVKYFH